MDWAISMGLFIIYILSLIIFLRPGLEEVADRTILLDILEDGFKNCTKHEFEKTPIIVNTSQISDKYALEINFVPKFPFDGEETGFTMMDKNLVQIPFKLNNKKINFNATIIGNDFKNLFWLVYKKDSGFNNIPPEGNPININSDPNFHYVLGITEYLEGIDENILDDLETEEGIRNLFNYPEQNGFLINITKDGTTREYQEGEFNEENIFVKETKDFILYEDGTREKITINFRVW